MYNKSINIFETYSEYENSRGALYDITLNYIKETGEIKSVEKLNYFYIESLEDNNKIFFGVDDTWFGTYKSNIYYSFNLYQWFSLSLITNLTLSKNQKVYFKGDGTDIQKSNEYDTRSLFKTTHKFNIGGNIKDVLNPNTAIRTFGYCNIFKSNSLLVDASKLILPATTLAGSCYENMFSGCISLTIAPELPATELADWCYRYMFANCTSLITAPELPATVLTPYCYGNMFYMCTSLTTAPELPATTLAGSCYDTMFYSCTSLTTAPELPATTLADGCYSCMFSDCTSLTTAPELPATELTPYCYSYMFQRCTSLTTVPEISAIKLVNRCYRCMFSGCNKLNYIKCLATNISATACTEEWVKGVSSTGTFVKHPDASWSTGVSGIPSGWTIEDAEILL